LRQQIAARFALLGGASSSLAWVPALRVDELRLAVQFEIACFSVLRR